MGANMRLMRPGKRAAMVVGLASLPFLSCLSAAAATITYKIDRTIGAGSVVGTIKTDGATGVLRASDIVSWNLTLTGVGAKLKITRSNSHVKDTGVDVTATANELSFNFDGADGGRLLFQTGSENGAQYYCDSATSGDCRQGETVAPRSFGDASTQNVAEHGIQLIGAVPRPHP
jgi:hypothetical protein